MIHTLPHVVLDDAECERADELLDRLVGRTVNMDGCWLWQGKPTTRGYGRTSTRRGRFWLVHRLVYVLAGGTIPPGWVLDHLCRTRLCCNPAHLEPVTLMANTGRGEIARGGLAECPTCGCTRHAMAAAT